MTKQNGSLRATAYHEAGHVVAAITLGLPVRSASIGPDGDALGKTSHPPPPSSFQPELALANDMRTRTRIESHVVMYLAGVEAERLVARRVSAHSGTHDFHEAVGLLEYLVGSNDELQAYVRWLEIRARQLVGSAGLRPALDAVAAALIARRTVSGREARRIFRAALAMTTTERGAAARRPG